MPLATPPAKPRPKPSPRAPPRPSPARPRRAPPRDSSPSATHATAVAPFNLVHPIRNQRIRLDPAYLFVLAHTIAIHRSRAIDHARYRSAVVVFLKTPPCFLLSTRSPPLLKNNCGLAQFLASKPLDFYLLEPAVQTLSFCTLALRFNC